MDSGIRRGEIMVTEQAHEHIIGVNTNVGREINSICRDVRTADHERDYRALGMLHIRTIRKYLAFEVAVAGIQRKGRCELQYLHVVSDFG